VIDLNIHVPDGSGSAVTAKLDLILAQLAAQSKQEKAIMASVTTLKQLVTDLDTETNDVAAKIDAQLAAIQALKDQIAAGGVATQADLDSLSDALTPVSERLKVLGSSQTDPIPAA
jgi:hypothetical protein